MASLIALVTNALWLRNQASTILKFHARPVYSEQRKGPVEWIIGLQFVVFLSIATNIGIFLSEFDAVSLFGLGKMELAFLLEHLLLLIWLFFKIYIPEMPGSVRKMIAKTHFESTN
jgi:hypothetical protein